MRNMKHQLAFFVPERIKPEFSNISGHITATATGGPYSHVAVMTKPLGRVFESGSNAVDAWWDGVHRVDIFHRLGDNGFSQVDIFDYVQGDDAYLGDFGFLYDQLNKPYDWVGLGQIAVITARKLLKKESSYNDVNLSWAWYCSELAHAFLVSLGLEEPPLPISPNGLARKPYLEKKATITNTGEVIFLGEAA